MENLARGNGIARIIYGIILVAGVGCTRNSGQEPVEKAAIRMPETHSISMPGEGTGNTYYVNPTGSDANPGTAAAPFATIQKAADLVNPGDVVVVQDGTYMRPPTSPDNGVVLIARGGVQNPVGSQVWVTFKAEHQGGAVIDGNANTTGNCVNINASFVLFEGFEVRNCAVVGVAVAALAHNVYVYGNHIHNIAWQVDSCSGYGNSGGYVDRGTSLITFDSNLIHTIGRNPNPPNPCLLPDGGVDSVTHTNDHGLYMYGSHNTVISNVVYDCTSGFEFQLSGGNAATDGSGWYVANNTFGPSNNPQETGAIMVWTEGTDQTTGQPGHPPTNVTIENNISYQPAGSTFIHNWYYRGDPTYTVRNNLTSGTLIGTDGFCDQTTPAPPPNCLTVNQSANLPGKDPLFVDAASSNFHLQSTSPALRAGNPTSTVTQDFDGNPVGPVPDLGAFQGPGTQESYGAMTIAGFNSATEFYFDSHSARSFIPVDFTASVISPAGTALSTGQMINVSGRVDSRGYMTASSVVVLTPASFSGVVIAGFNSASEFYFDSHSPSGFIPVDFTASVVSPAGTTLATGQTVNVSGGLDSRGYLTASAVQVVSP